MVTLNCIWFLLLPSAGLQNTLARYILVDSTLLAHVHNEAFEEPIGTGQPIRNMFVRFLHSRSQLNNLAVSIGAPKMVLQSPIRTERRGISNKTSTRLEKINIMAPVEVHTAIQRLRDTEGHCHYLGDTTSRCKMKNWQVAGVDLV